MRERDPEVVRVTAMKRWIQEVYLPRWHGKPPELIPERTAVSITITPMLQEFLSTAPINAQKFPEALAQAFAPEPVVDGLTFDLEFDHVSYEWRLVILVKTPHEPLCWWTLAAGGLTSAEGYDFMFALMEYPRLFRQHARLEGWPGYTDHWVHPIDEVARDEPKKNRIALEQPVIVAGIQENHQRLPAKGKQEQEHQMLLTVKQAAVRLGISVRTVYILIQRKELVSITLSERSRRISIEAIERYIAHLEEQASA